MKSIKILLKSFFISIIFLTGVQLTSANTSFSFSVPEGQGGGNNEFYHGRCARVDVMLDTDGNDTGGADLEINYDPARITIVNNNCSTAATTIYHDSQFQNYTNNHVVSGTGKITLGSYNNPGIPYNGNGRFASFYFTVLDGAGNYDLDFEATPGVTTDSNLAEYGTGNDILDDAFSYTLNFADDNDTPYVNNLNPANATTGVQVISNIQFRLNDDDAGIDISTLSFNLTGANWGVTNYTEASPQVSYTCHTTNANRVDYCDVTLNPSNNLYYCENYTVNITVSDLGNPTVHTLAGYNYSFDTEPDNDAPTIYNLNPAEGSFGSSTTTNVYFELRDIAEPGAYPGTGVDIATLIVDVSAPGWGDQTYTTASVELATTPTGVNDYGNVYDYNIDIDPATDFPENTLVTVRVRANDYGCPGIDSLDRTYTFTTEDTMGPICDLFSPAQNVVNMGTADDITFRCTDNGVGIDINRMNVVVDKVIYTTGGANQFTYVGTPAEYYITVNPIADIALDYALETIINGADFSNNHISQISYGLATGTTGGTVCPVCPICPICPTCETCEICEDDTETIIKTEYQQCTPIERIKEVTLLQSKSKIANTQIKGIKLNLINDIDINIGNNQSNTLVTTLVQGEKKVLVTVYDDIVVFEGSAIPNTQVTLMIESDPIIVTGLSDNKGQWRIEMANIFTNGMHKVSAIVMSEDNYIVNTKHLANFEVKRSVFSWWCWLIIVFLFSLFIITYKKYQKFKRKYCEVRPKECKKISKKQKVRKKEVRKPINIKKKIVKKK